MIDRVHPGAVTGLPNVAFSGATLAARPLQGLVGRQHPERRLSAQRGSAILSVQVATPSTIETLMAGTIRVSLKPARA